MARPKRSEPVDLQTAIKETAWKQIAEQGAAALSLRAIARELHITAPAIYNYFPRRDDLVTALVADAFTSFGSALELARDACPPNDHAGRFRAISLAYRQWAVTYPQRYLLIFGTPIAGYELGAEAGPAAQRSFLVLVGVLGEAYQAKKIRLAPKYVALTPGLLARYQVLNQTGMPYAPVVTQLALASWSWIHGLASLELYGYLADFLADQAEAFIRFEIERYLQMLGLGDSPHV
jgi:AcrR family transcriptional regulator